MRWVILLALLLAPLPALAATLSGTAYTQNLAGAQYAILTINTTPEQRLILDDGSYNITVPPGTYLLKASLRQSGRRYEDEVVVRVVDEREYVYDLILFPVEREADDDMPDPTLGLEFDDPAPTGNGWWGAVIWSVAGLAAIAAVWWRWRPRRRPSPGLPGDLSLALAALKAEGGRASQKELRKRLPYSEAKVSMMLADLESRGLVRRIKQGRGNLIVLR